MSEEIDREVTSKKVTSLPNNSMNGSRISEQRTTKVANDVSGNGLVIIGLLALAIGAGAIAYFVNYRPAPTPVLIPNATDTVKENKSTVIERNNTTIREVSPATPEPTPTVEINVPVTITQPPAAAPVPAPRVTTPMATTAPQPVAPTATPQVTTQPQTSTPSPKSGN
jgi:cytoskeletal protein RodZ